MTILKLRNYNDINAFIGYDLISKRVCKLDARAPIGGAFKKVGKDDYWGFVDGKLREMNENDYFFFHNSTSYNFEDLSVLTTIDNLSPEKAGFSVLIDGKERENVIYSRHDNFDPSGWLDESELDIFAIINSEIKKTR